MSDCTHAIARSLSLVRVPSAGQAAGVSAWTWAARTAHEQAGDRFVVATEPVPETWRGCVDVVLATARASVDDALAVPFDSGCALTATPVSGLGTVLCLQGGEVIVVPDRLGVCGICLYPWLVVGADLTEVTGHRLEISTSVPSPRRGSAAR